VIIGRWKIIKEIKEIMKVNKIKQFFIFCRAAIIVLVTYILYVIDNLLSIFGVNTKLPFDDFLSHSYVSKWFYFRILVVLPIILCWWLISK